MTRPASPQEIAAALGGGKEQRTSGGWKTLCPLHDDSTPSLIIYEKGHKDGKPWADCPVCGRNKDLYDAIETRTGMHFAGRTRQTSDNKVKCIYPATRPWQPMQIKGKAPSAHWEYHNTKGELMFVVARYEFPDGKTIRPWSVIERNGQDVWAPKLALNPIPMYNAKTLADNPDKKVLIVEGEKTAEAAKWLPEFEDCIVTTYQGGGKNWTKADKSLLRGREILLWPDNDNVGKDAFRSLSMWLNTDGFCKSVLVAHVSGSAFPPKWDLADPFPDGASFASVPWKPGPKPDRVFQLKNVDPGNFMEVFDSMYYLYHDGREIYTISKEYAEFRKGAAVGPHISHARMKINRVHEAYNCCAVEKRPAILVWADEKMHNRDFIQQFGFYPDKATAVVEDKGVKSFNGFTGWTHQPKQHGSCEMFKELILEVLSGGDEESYRYIWNFLSHMIQYPGEKPDVALLFKGEKGTGKSIFFSVIAQLLGSYDGYGHQVNSSATFGGAFNTYLSCNLGLFVHEWEITKSRSIENVVKSIITEDVVSINTKNIPAYSENNYTRVMGATNHNHVWNASHDERRISIFHVSNAKQRQNEWFEAMMAEMNNGGYGRLMYELSETVVNKSLVRNPFENQALAVQKEFSRTPAQSLAFDLLTQGKIHMQILDERREIAQSYHLSYKDWSDLGGRLPQKLTNDFIKIKYIRRGGEAYSPRDPEANYKGVLEWLGGDKGRTTGDVSEYGSMVRTNFRKFPKLQEARVAYANKAGLDVEELFDLDGDVIPFPEAKGKVVDDVPF